MAWVACTGCAHYHTVCRFRVGRPSYCSVETANRPWGPSLFARLLLMCLCMAGYPRTSRSICSRRFCSKYLRFMSFSSRTKRSISYLYSLTCDEARAVQSESIDTTDNNTRAKVQSEPMAGHNTQHHAGQVSLAFSPGWLGLAYCTYGNTADLY